MTWVSGSPMQKRWYHPLVYRVKSLGQFKAGQNPDGWNHLISWAKIRYLDWFSAVWKHFSCRAGHLDDCTIICNHPAVDRIWNQTGYCTYFTCWLSFCFGWKDVKWCQFACMKITWSDYISRCVYRLGNVQPWNSGLAPLVGLANSLQLDVACWPERFLKGKPDRFGSWG